MSLHGLKALQKAPRRRTVLRSVSVAALGAIAGCSATPSESERTDGGEAPTNDTPRVRDVDSVEPTPAIILRNRISEPVTVDVSILDGADTAFSDRMDLEMAGERTMSDLGLGEGEYTLRVVRGQTRAEATWKITHRDGRIDCSPSCSAFVFVRPEEVELSFVTLY